MLLTWKDALNWGGGSVGGRGRWPQVSEDETPSQCARMSRAGKAIEGVDGANVARSGSVSYGGEAIWTDGLVFMFIIIFVCLLLFSWS